MKSQVQVGQGRGGAKCFVPNTLAETAYVFAKTMILCTQIRIFDGKTGLSFPVTELLKTQFFLTCKIIPQFPSPWLSLNSVKPCEPNLPKQSPGPTQPPLRRGPLGPQEHGLNALPPPLPSKGSTHL